MNKVFLGCLSVGALALVAVSGCADSANWEGEWQVVKNGESKGQVVIMSGPPDSEYADQFLMGTRKKDGTIKKPCIFAKNSGSNVSAECGSSGVSVGLSIDGDVITVSEPDGDGDSYSLQRIYSDS